MNFDLTVFVHGIPKGQPRPRAFARKMGDKFVARMYEAGTAESWKSEIAAALRPHIPETPIMGAISLELVFLMPRPKAHRYKYGTVKDHAPSAHTGKPDVDNLFKATTDAMKTLGMMADDAQISATRIQKLYGNRMTGALVKIRSLKEAQLSKTYVELIENQYGRPEPTTQ